MRGRRSPCCEEQHNPYSDECFSLKLVAKESGSNKRIVEQKTEMRENLGEGEKIKVSNIYIYIYIYMY